MADVGGPVIAIAIVLAAVFVPVAFLAASPGSSTSSSPDAGGVRDPLGRLRAHLHARHVRAAPAARRAGHERGGPLSRFFARFNRGFERTRNGYLASVSTMVRHAVLVMLTFGVLLVAIWGLIAARPTGLVPSEDQGYAFAVLALPNGASLERTNAAMAQVSRIARETPGVDGVIYISGFNLITGQSVSYNGTAFIRFKPWAERKASRCPSAASCAR